MTDNTQKTSFLADFKDSNDAKAAFQIAVEARNAYWDALGDLEAQLGIEVEGDDLNDVDPDWETFLTSMDEKE